ncbi:MAG: winged helix-turn-helix transcriptional regulator [Candidatus Heimdallarchaeota archaeon]|nr:winged helix-turn-helix transcriptional regulator [Candidatus Heimdallarchaeota archaeon]
MSNSRRILSFIILNLILSLIAIQVSSNYPTANLDSMSMVFTDSNNNIVHLQVNSEGVKRIWQKPVSVGYHSIKITDLDLDGKKEVLAVNNDYTIVCYDYETGDIEWEYLFPTQGTLNAQINIGYITGDGYNEIIFNRAVGSYLDISNRTLLIVTHEGETLGRINALLLGGSTGFDNVNLIDLDGDNDMEIITSQGSTLWQPGVGGTYNISAYDWDVSLNMTKKLWSIQDDDIGGNTQLISTIYEDEPYIITAGWYNNPIRAFDKNGQSIWNRTLIESDYLLWFAEPHLNVNNNHLFVAQQQYYYKNDSYKYSNDSKLIWNYTPALFDIDIKTGEDLSEPINFPNSRMLITKNIDSNKIAIASIDRKVVSEEDEEVIIDYNMGIYSISNNELIAQYLTDDNIGWSRIFNFLEKSIPLLDLGEEYPGIIVLDNYDRMWISTPSKNIQLTKYVVGITNAFVANQEEKLDGTFIANYPNIQFVSIIIIILVNILLFISMILAYTYIDNKFHESFGRDWKFQAFKRMKSIFKSLETQEGINKQLFALNAVTEDEITDLNSEQLTALAPVQSEEFRNFVNIWLKEHEKEMSKIKAGDVAILVELLGLYPGVINAKELSQSFDVAKSTLYRRVDFLMNIGLIESAKVTDKTDLRSNDIEISVNGIEFLKSIFSSISFYFS